MHNRCIAAIAMAVAACDARVDAGYVMSITSAGSDTATVAPGDSIVLDVIMTQDAAELHNSAIYRVVFSEPGLRYDGYQWSAPYLNGTIDDDSKPLAGVLPAVLGDATLTGIGYPAGVVDIELSNVLPIGPNFGGGIVTSMTLTVPIGYSGAEQVVISIAPDEIALNGGDIPTRAEGFFTLIVPQPASAAVLAVAALTVARRRGGRPATGP